jgi:hypothetical protein
MSYTKHEPYENCQRNDTVAPPGGSHTERGPALSRRTGGARWEPPALAGGELEMNPGFSPGLR